MKFFIAAVPLFNSSMAVEAYRMSFQNGEKLFGISQNHMALDDAVSSPGIDMLNRIGLEPFTGGKPIYVEVNKFLLLMDSIEIKTIPPKLMACILGKDIPAEQVYFDKVNYLKNQGHPIMMYNMPVTDQNLPFFKLADDVLFDTTVPYWDCLKGLRLRFPECRAVLSNVKDKEIFDAIKSTPNALFEGWFYNEPLTAGVAKVNPLKTNALHLLKLIGQDDFDLDEVSRIVQKDPALTISLLKFINSPMIGMSNKVNSIRSAVALLGQKETRKWVNAAVSLYLGVDKPNEITRLSLIRAKFAENLATAFEMGMHDASLFLMGLFSLLNVILDKPMEQALEEIAIKGDVRKALVDKSGKYYEVLHLIYCYEQADWSGVSYIMVLNNINLGDLNKAFIDALVWYRELLDEMI